MSLKAIRKYFIIVVAILAATTFTAQNYSCATDNNNNVSAGQCFKNEHNTKPWHIFYSCYLTRGISILNVPTSTWKEWACVCMLAVSQLKTKISDKLCFSLLEL